VRTNALLIDAARLLSDPRHNLVVVCDDIGRMAGVITQDRHCQPYQSLRGLQLHDGGRACDHARGYLLPSKRSAA
jgi:hypothetical protein